MSKTLCLLFLLAVVCQSTHGQFVEDFEDGDLTESPHWTGELDRWFIEDTPGGKRLATRGLAESDTLLLSTNSPSAYGTWNLRYGYRGGPLSNFNQVRVVLWSATREPATVYYLLIGSNDRTLKLYTSDTAFGERELVGSAADDILSSDSAAIQIRVEHDYSNNWRAWLDGRLVIEEGPPADPLDADGEFGLWIKHTAARGSDHWFDDISATRAVESDNTGPLMESVMIEGPQMLSVRFSEPVATESACLPNAYSLDSGDAPIAVYCPTGLFTDTVSIETSNPLPSGINRLTAHSVADPSGNVTPISTIDFDMPDHGDPPQPRDLVINEIDFAPAIPESEFVEIYNRSPRRIDLSSIWLGDDRSAAPVTTRRILMEPGAFAVVTRDSTSLTQRFPDLPAIEMDGWPTLNNSGDSVMLIHESDTLDAVTYAPHPGGTTGSLERIDPEAPSDFPPNWIRSVSPDGATPGQINSVFLPDNEPPDLQFVEQTSATAVRAVFTEPLPVARIEAVAFELNGKVPDVIAPGTPHYSNDYFLLFESVESGTLRASQIADASGNLRVETNSAVHLLPRPGELIINEIMFEPRI
ncbi:MAG: lamin tail domain-containing protein, partial [Rhodothermales bacterium]|nr:lamin tail domain-containing protein [Rhodothermales bacterium]